jgi:uncharacterized alpha-E superfamily protein
MISRVADHCFWFGRYVDRAESTARLLQVTRTLVFDADIPVTQCWKPLVIVAGAEANFTKRYGAPAMGNGETVQSYMTWEPENLVSLLTSVRAARESARVIRDVLSLEAWEEVNEFYHWLNGDEAREVYAKNREQFYRRVRKSTQLVLGLVRSTMLHETPLSLLWAGVMLERVGQTARTLDMHPHTMELESAHQIVEVALWLSLLRASSGYEAFVKKYQGRISAQSVASFLVFDRTFPRSLRYCLGSARKILTDIWPGAEDPGPGHASYARLDALTKWVDKRQVTATPAGIHDLLTRVVDEIAEVCSSIGREILGPPAPEKDAESTPVMADCKTEGKTEGKSDGRTSNVDRQTQSQTMQTTTADGARQEQVNARTAPKTGGPDAPAPPGSPGAPGTQ